MTNFAFLIYTYIQLYIYRTHRLVQQAHANIMYISVLFSLYLFLVLHAELLMSYCPLVERLGFDENFMDITKMAERRLPESDNISFKGHVYNHFSKSLLCLWCVAACTSGSWKLGNEL